MRRTGAAGTQRAARPGRVFPMNDHAGCTHRDPPQWAPSPDGASRLCFNLPHASGPPACATLHGFTSVSGASSSAPSSAAIAFVAICCREISRCPLQSLPIRVPTRSAAHHRAGLPSGSPRSSPGPPSPPPSPPHLPTPPSAPAAVLRIIQRSAGFVHQPLPLRVAPMGVASISGSTGGGGLSIVGVLFPTVLGVLAMVAVALVALVMWQRAAAALTTTASSPWVRA